MNPQPLPLYDGPAAWRGPEMRNRRDWLYSLSDSEKDELIEAAEHSERRAVPLTELTQETFPLPRLGPACKSLQQEIVAGRGFVLLRGLPVELPRPMVARIYLGLGSHFGDPVPQNAKGHLLGHILDLGLDPLDPTVRVYTTNYRHLFHTDSCDIAALLCLQAARTGGESAIASSTSLYNEIARRRPDLARLLAEPFTVDRKGEIPAGKGPTYKMAIFHHHQGQLTTIYSRDFITVAQQRAEVTPLTSPQVEAMDLMDELAASDEFRLDMDFQPGDVQILHNHQILHARTAYQDYPEAGRKRHLLRLWLSAPNGRPLPPVFAERYGEIRVGRRRGGIIVPGAKPTVPLEPE